MKLKLLIPILLFNCFLPPNNPNQEFTISKFETENKITEYTFIKSLSCNFDSAQSFFFSELGNDEDPEIDTRNKTILYEKKAVNHCLSSILIISCPNFPRNTTQAIELMAFNITSNRVLNCTFNTLEFFTFEKPRSGSFWQP
jgi:hypothetical protein